MPFDTSVLDAALRERQARYEQSRVQTLAKVLDLLDLLGPDYGLQEAYVFGSLAGPGRFRPESDVDIAVVLAGAESLFRLSAELSIRLVRDVDLIELDKCFFADKIRREGVRWTPSN